MYHVVYLLSCRSLLQEVGSQVLDQRSLLVLLLLLERCKGQQSAFAPYIDLLPQTYGKDNCYVVFS